MRLEAQSCDLGVGGGRYGTCALDTKAVAAGTHLSGRQRAARAVAGALFIAAAVPLLRTVPGRALGAAAGWFGISHIVAAVTAFDGCPELGAIPSAVLRRPIATECGPWRRLDERLGLKPADS